MTGIFFGSSTGNTELLAGEIASKLDVAKDDVYDVGRTDADKVLDYDLILLGSSTWGLGELQDDWYGFLDVLKGLYLSGKRVGLFGCGDSSSYPDTFCNALGIIREAIAGTGCIFVGETDGGLYPVDDSQAFSAGRAIGLLADDDDPGQTDVRMEQWIATIKG